MPTTSYHGQDTAPHIGMGVLTVRYFIYLFIYLFMFMFIFLIQLRLRKEVVKIETLTPGFEISIVHWGGTEIRRVLNYIDRLSYGIILHRSFMQHRYWLYLVVLVRFVDLRPYDLCFRRSLTDKLKIKDNLIGTFMRAIIKKVNKLSFSDI